jgi:hypothetical protein
MIEVKKHTSVRTCASCHTGPEGTSIHDYSIVVNPDSSQGAYNSMHFYLCSICGEKLYKELGDILGCTPKETEEPSIRAHIEKIIAEFDFVEVTLPDGTVIRANKNG